MFLTENELLEIGFKHLGNNVKISSKASIYGASNISIGNNVRIDDFTILSAASGSITLHNHIHIAAFCNLIGSGEIEMHDFSGLSSRTSLYSASDDYSGNYLIGPIMEKECLNVIAEKITLHRFVTVGTNSTVLPGVTANEGSVLGAYSMANKNMESWFVYVGVPAKKFKKRASGLLELVKIMDQKWM
jgi:acetyltransferase-like isoleucine patch superfamily enzyme